MGRAPEEAQLQRGHTEGPEPCETVLNITDHQRDARENHRRHHPTPVRMAAISKRQTSAGEDVERREPSCTVGGSADCAAPVDSSVEVPHKTKWNCLKTQ